MTLNSDIKTIGLSLCTFLTALLTSVVSYADKRQCTKVNLAGHPNLPPIIWADYQQTLGAAPELIADILNEHNINSQSDYFGSDRRVSRKLIEGKVAINPAMIRLPELEKDILFLEPPIYTQRYAVLVKRGQHQNLNSWNDLKDLLGVTPKGLSLGRQFDRFAEENLKLIKTYHARQGLLMLNVGRVDYAIYPDVQGDLFMSLMDFEQRFEKANIDIGSFKLYVGLSKQLNCFLPATDLSRSLMERILSGEFEHTVNDNLYKWMGFSLQKKLNQSP